MLGDVGDQTKASGSNPSASITVTRCPLRTASMALTLPTAPNPMTVTCWGCVPFLMGSATRGRDAAAMIERRADEIVARFRGTERGMGREGDVFQRRQDVAGRQGL
jgi:hypothetical protein